MYSCKYPTITIVYALNNNIFTLGREADHYSQTVFFHYMVLMDMVFMSVQIEKTSNCFGNYILQLTNHLAIRQFFLYMVKHVIMRDQFYQIMLNV